MIRPGQIIGIIGNGQLGRMSAIEAKKLGYTVYVYGPGIHSPAGQVCDLEVNGAYDDVDLISSFAQGCHVITFEFENIPADILSAIQTLTPIHPDPEVLQISQNRLTEKNWFSGKGFPTTPYASVRSAADVAAQMEKWKSRAVLKTLTLGYDGKGQAKLHSPSDAESAWNGLNAKTAILEQWVDFQAEISVIVARNAHGQVAVFPVFENSHRNHILDTTFFPARLDESIQKEAIRIASDVAEHMGLIGLLTIELFVDRSGNLLINEIAPRPHNSGHVTFNTGPVSQFEQHIRAVCGLPLGSTQSALQGVMINILGDSWKGGEPVWSSLLSLPSVHLHLYGKTDPKPGRKMGHVTITGNPVDRSLINKVRDILKIPPLDGK